MRRVNYIRFLLLIIHFSFRFYVQLCACQCLIKNYLLTLKQRRRVYIVMNVGGHVTLGEITVWNIVSAMLLVLSHKFIIAVMHSFINHLALFTFVSTRTVPVARPGIKSGDKDVLGDGLA